MERFNKKTMNIYSVEYDELLKREISVWSNYETTEEKISSYEQLKSSPAFLTYRKGSIELEMKFIKESGDGISVLELGSADGWLTNEILKLDNVKDITSIDISLENNKEKYNERALAVRGDLNKIDEIQFDQQYDCIITHGTLHHLVDPKRTLQFCIDKLLKHKGIIIINDTWELQSLQLKTNAFFYTLLNRIPHHLLKLEFRKVLKTLFKTLPKILKSKDFAASIVHSHDTSPFESISSADDYKDIYNADTVQLIYLKRFAALSGIQSIWSRSPIFIKKFIQYIDNFLIVNNIFSGDIHLSILRKK